MRSWTVSAKAKLKASSLRFFLYSRSLHPELFDIYQKAHVVQGDYEARIWITGCTHVISFAVDKQVLTEVIADAEAMLPQRGLVLNLPFRGEKRHQTDRGPHLRYLTNFQVESMSPMVYNRTHHELARLGANRGLFVPFPTWRSRSLTPFAYVDYQAKVDQLHVLAFHAFPQDLTIIKTQSIFELR